MLPTEHGEMVDLALIFIQRIAREGGLAVDRQWRTVAVHNSRCLTRPVRDLKLAGGGAEHRTEPILIIEYVFEIAEPMVLRGVIVIGRRRAIWRFDTQTVAQEIARHKIVEAAIRTAVVETRLHRSVAAPVEGD